MSINQGKTISIQRYQARHSVHSRQRQCHSVPISSSIRIFWGKLHYKQLYHYTYQQQSVEKAYLRGDSKLNQCRNVLAESRIRA